MSHPRLGDTPQGTAVWSDDEARVLFVLTWREYSPNRGTYYGVRTEWQILSDVHALRFMRVTFIAPYNSQSSESSEFVPLHHRSLAARWARERWGLGRAMNVFM